MTDTVTVARGPLNTGFWDWLAHPLERSMDNFVGEDETWSRAPAGAAFPAPTRSCASSQVAGNREQGALGGQDPGQLSAPKATATGGFEPPRALSHRPRPSPTQARRLPPRILAATRDSPIPSPGPSSVGPLASPPCLVSSRLLVPPRLPPPGLCPPCSRSLDTVSTQIAWQTLRSQLNVPFGPPEALAGMIAEAPWLALGPVLHLNAMYSIPRAGCLGGGAWLHVNGQWAACPLNQPT
ncbi:hypothetical protein J1605_006769 [Eschrichtius robustus]|uniref:Uncharacterized protein n=1 Tax=Eschrichtius robustus TaxID=9764 RepID=A0AB34H530_ESCRO|nr:hypothetical protein J1605_006769 [Eschrichtius robustus]